MLGTLFPAILQERFLSVAIAAQLARRLAVRGTFKQYEIILTGAVTSLNFEPKPPFQEQQFLLSVTIQTVLL